MPEQEQIRPAIAAEVPAPAPLPKQENPANLAPVPEENFALQDPYLQKRINDCATAAGRIAPTLLGMVDEGKAYGVVVIFIADANYQKTYVYTSVENDSDSTEVKRIKAEKKKLIMFFGMDELKSLVESWKNKLSNSLFRTTKPTTVSN